MQRIDELKRRLVDDAGIDKKELEIHLVSHKAMRRMQPYGNAGGMVIYHRDREYMVFLGPVKTARLTDLDLLLVGFGDLLDQTTESAELEADLLAGEDEADEVTIHLKLRELVYAEPDPAGRYQINGQAWTLKPLPPASDEL